MNSTHTTPRDSISGAFLDTSQVEVYEDTAGMLHGDIFCRELTQDGGEWRLVAADHQGANTCPACFTDALHPLVNPDTLKEEGPELNPQPPSGQGTGTGTTTSNRVTEKQVAFIESLLAQVPEEKRGEYLSQEVTRLDKRTASELIDTLKGAVEKFQAEAPQVPVMDLAAFGAIADGLGRKFTPEDLTPELKVFALSYAASYTGDFDFMLDMRQAAQTKGSLSPGMAKGVLNVARAEWNRRPQATDDSPELPDVPEGRWAYYGGDGNVVFVKVDRPTQGRWAGYTFGKYLTGGGLDGELVEAARVPKAALATVLGHILELGLDESAALFGRTAKRCSRCGRSLADQDNPYFAQGYGPDCGALVFG